MMLMVVVTTTIILRIKVKVIRIKLAWWRRRVPRIWGIGLLRV